MPLLNFSKISPALKFTLLLWHLFNDGMMLDSFLQFLPQAWWTSCHVPTLRLCSSLDRALFLPNTYLLKYSIFPAHCIRTMPHCAALRWQLTSSLARRGSRWMRPPTIRLRAGAQNKCDKKKTKLIKCAHVCPSHV